MSIIIDLEATAHASQAAETTAKARLHTLVEEVTTLRAAGDAVELDTADLGALGRLQVRCGLVEREIGRASVEAEQAARHAEHANRAYQDARYQVEDTERVLTNLANTSLLEVRGLSLNQWQIRIEEGRKTITHLTGRTDFTPVSFTV